MRYAVLLLAVAGTPVFADVQNEPHLKIIPRTSAEVARIKAATAPARDFSKAQPFEAKSGGAATVRARNSADAFSQPSANLPFAEELNFKLGNGLFRKLWVSSPSSTKASDGLGPLFNARSCQRCHIKDGRGHGPDGPDDSALSMLVRLSIPVDDTVAKSGITGYLATQADPVYGGQLQDFGTPGQQGEGRIKVTYSEQTVSLSGGETVVLRKPELALTDLGYGPMHVDVMTSVRIAPPMIGLGLLEAIPAADILANADPDDVDGDGISGRANVIWSRSYDQPMLGRFGWKAGMPTVREQSAGAFSGDMGLSTPLFPEAYGDCTQAQKDCIAGPHGDKDERTWEVGEEALDLVAFYSRNLAVPARRNVEAPNVLQGKAAFYAAGCPACHVPSFVTHRLKNDPAQSFQLIWPYSDLLLHDMGEDLADHRPEARADGFEWRTPPLWGIGLAQRVSKQATFLHDGRARSLLEAILWHGGEASNARDKVVAMPLEERAKLIEFLESL